MNDCRDREYEQEGALVQFIEEGHSPRSFGGLDPVPCPHCFWYYSLEKKHINWLNINNPGSQGPEANTSPEALYY